MFGGRYQWILVDGALEGWTLGSRATGCATDSLLTAADGSIKLQIRTLGNTKTPGISGRVRNFDPVHKDQSGVDHVIM